MQWRTKICLLLKSHWHENDLCGGLQCAQPMRLLNLLQFCIPNTMLISLHVHQNVIPDHYVSMRSSAARSSGCPAGEWHKRIRQAQVMHGECKDRCVRGAGARAQTHTHTQRTGARSLLHHPYNGDPRAPPGLRCPPNVAVGRRICPFPGFAVAGTGPPGYLGAPRRAPPGAHCGPPGAPGYLGAIPRAPPGARGRPHGNDTLQMLP